MNDYTLTLPLHQATMDRHVLIARSDPADERPAYMHFNDEDSGIENTNDCNKTWAHLWYGQPGTELTNPATGDITIVPDFFRDEGKALTLDRLSMHLSLGPREVRSMLVSIGILHREVTVKHVATVLDPSMTKPEYSHEHRLSEWAVKMRYGRRVKSPKGFDFDLITRSGIAYVKEMCAIADTLAKAGDADPMADPNATPKEVIRTMLSAAPSLRAVDIIKATGLAKATVCRHVAALKAAA